MGVACSTYGERRGVHRFMMGKRDGKRPLVRRRLMLKWTFKTGMDWIALAQNRYRWRVLVIAIMNLQVP